MFHNVKHILILHVSRQDQVNSVGSECVVEVLEQLHILLVALGASGSVQKNNLCVVVIVHNRRNRIDVKDYLYGHTENFRVSL